MDKSFDLVVLGAGSGGLAAAKRAAAHGAKVAIVEGDRVGGTCVIRGCVPKKLLVYGSLYKEYINNASAFGVEIKNVSFSTSKLLANVRAEVDRLNSLHIELLRKGGVQLISGWGSFVSGHTIQVSSHIDGEKFRTISGEKILVAVGGVPDRLSIPGSELAWVSDDIFEQKVLPENIIIVGAGFIACEFSCILNSLGLNVTQLVRGTSLLKGFDSDLSNILEKHMIERGIELNFETYPLSIQKINDNLHINTNHDKTINAKSILFAIGRKPRLKRLNLPAAGVRTDKGRITVDLRHQTNISHIFAIGDVANRINLTPVAVDEGRALSDFLFAHKNRKVNYELVPSAVFSQPEIAAVGLTEHQATELYGKDNIKIYRTKFKSMATALPKRGAPCLLKLVAIRNTGKIIGCHMVGEHSSEIIQMAAIALQMGATKSDFDKTMALHPTVAEEFVTMT